MSLKINIAVSIISLCIVSSCGQKKTPKSDIKNQQVNTVTEKDYLQKIFDLDTLPPGKGRMAIILKEDSVFKLDANYSANPFYHYFKARTYEIEKKTDSAIIAYKKMKSKKKWDDIDLLKTYSIIDHTINNGVMVEAVLMNQIVAATQIAERKKSKLVYKYYDLLAKAYYQNQNNKQALYYSELYYQRHPYNWHRVVKQRYYDICFLLASRLQDYKKMASYNTKARLLAKTIPDSMALARTYDNESQIYALQKDYRNSLASSKIYFNYLAKINMLHDVACNNLAKSYLNVNQPDSGVFYFKKGIELAKSNNPAKQKSYLYKGLIDAYAMKGDYEQALGVAITAHAIEIENLKAIDAVKTEELHEKYEAEKKDQNIAVLKSKNQLSESIIRQQKWLIFSVLMVFLGTIALIYTIYRQRSLKEKNKLLRSENQRLNIEQKLLQAQLNPHFVFNAIANLQSLIASGDTSESVRYLSFFSKLLRNVLEQSRRDFIPIEEEIASLHNYMQLQQMRYHHLFDYEIVADELDTESTLIPPMLVQPFIENAIEHGFRNIQYRGMLKIQFKLANEQLLITVDDNGSGITKKGKLQSGKTSLAQVILKQRLQVLFKLDCQQANFAMVDKKINNDKGIKVQITIPAVYD
ncbi:sensor histidine kinase [Pedobacter psychrodurus]|uniref:Sensor histidine kinase n=1 Tax=Pedobacter psychrodurus TaxID=2530456 RepID=A0A4R0PKI6_9SPHI|nr:histidine kinase [Pedobacter psychrodurus]TCD16856.1 sensor histidine kinase [Pedobacter psychrodurus]